MSTFEPCPYCHKEEATPVKFTPWGGVIGPRVFSLVECEGCGKQFNGKSGRRVEKQIRVYTLLTMAVLAIVAAWAIYSYVGPARPAGETRHAPLPMMTT